MDSNKTVNPDLKNERQKCTFNPLELTYLVYEGRDRNKQRKEIENFFFSDPDLQDKVPLDFLSHKEKYEETIRKACVIHKKLLEYRSIAGHIDSETEKLLQSVIAAVLKDGNPFGLNTVMFVPALLGQGTPEQQSKWLKRAIKYEIIGTELGHGTFIRGLETTAHYDPNTQEFILNSPTLSSYKWWMPSMGHTANYAVVMAQLYTQGVRRGIHLFIVQIRDEETHEPMPGIKVGEIGTKVGMHAINNGYLGFENVRIPRNRMLMKNAQLPDGSYVKAPSDKLTYGAMMFVRVIMLQGAAAQLAQASTIAIRYSVVRRQSEMKPGEPEPQILDYRTQQYKLFPNLATSLAIKQSASFVWKMYTDNFVIKFDSSGNSIFYERAKAVCTSTAAQGVETCRLSCGGHGYMTCSNFSCIYGVATASCTYEGENTVLLLQTARYLMKAWQQAVSGVNLTPTVAYLKEALSERKSSQQWENSIPHIVKAFQRVSAGKVRMGLKSLQKRINGGFAPEVAWNSTSIELAECAEAHARTFLVETFIKRIAEINCSVALKTVLVQLSELFAIYTLLRNKGDFLAFSNMTPQDISGLQVWMENLLEALRPNAVGIVDGFDFHDRVLSSALGAYDGRVYERLFEEASKSPLNKETVNQSFHKYLKPFLKSSL
ncbi:hypothetical protein L9F63_005751 [Diploptera punctata]|uniref:Acyl-coenzyme A oxidase n=1 Tax=Diploptera punctata TaxID=6984 RepID=A0AAD7ZBW4_DIPPU|nr:hypothetical protein L9F63_005751 [Diploptera punctata]